MSTAALGSTPQAIPGAETQVERTVVARWPSIASTRTGRTIGALISGAPRFRLPWFNVNIALAPALLLAPIGAFKGAGLAMMMGILSSMLSGAAYGTESGDMEDGPLPGVDGHFVAAINISAFEGLARFKSRVDTAVRQIHQCQLAEGVERVYAPGELEALTRVEYLEDGIPLNDVTVADLVEVSRTLDIEPSPFAQPG